MVVKQINKYKYKLNEYGYQSKEGTLFLFLHGL